MTLRLYLRLLNNIKQTQSLHSRTHTAINILQTKRTYILSNCQSHTPFKQPTWSLTVREKSKKSKAKQTIEDEETESETEDDDSDGGKLIKSQVHSMRLDALVKSGLNMARNKVETVFYESRIRVNGKKPTKKSAQVVIGDEIDLIRERSNKNENFLLVSRLVIVSTHPRNDGLSVTMKRFKSLLIENYEDKWTE